MVTKIEAVPDKPEARFLEGVVAAPVLEALRAAHDKLSALGIPHVVVGGLAVGAWGHPRATKDVDFLVSEVDAFDASGPLVTFKPGVPIQAGGVAVDYLTVESLNLTKPPVLTLGGGFVALEVLFLLKLRAHRMQDEADVVSLLKKGAPVQEIDAWLRGEGHAPEADRLRKLVERAREES